MFGFNEMLMSYIRKQLGLRDDAANENGSVQAKLKHLLNTTNASVKNKLEIIDFKKATLDKCLINDNNEIELSTGDNPTPITLETTNNGYFNVFDLEGGGIRLESGYTSKMNGITKVEQAVNKVGSPTTPLRCDIFNVTTGKLLARKKLQPADINGVATFNFPAGEVAYNNTDVIEIRFYVHEQEDGGSTDSSNYYKFLLNTSSSITDIKSILTTNYNNWSTSVSYVFVATIIFVDNALSGTITKIISPNIIEKWGALFQNSILPVSGNSCITKITALDDTILLDNLTSNAENISSIDVSSHKAIKVVITLSRANRTDTPPKLIYASVTFLGSGMCGIEWDKKTFELSASISTNHSSYTHIDLKGSGYLIYLNGNNVTFCIQIDGGEIYAISTTVDTGGFSLFPIRFNSSIKITASKAPSISSSVGVILD